MSIQCHSQATCHQLRGQACTARWSLTGSTSRLNWVRRRSHQVAHGQASKQNHQRQSRRAIDTCAHASSYMVGTHPHFSCLPVLSSYMGALSSPFPMHFLTRPHMSLLFLRGVCKAAVLQISRISDFRLPSETPAP